MLNGLLNVTLCQPPVISSCSLLNGLIDLEAALSLEQIFWASTSTFPSHAAHFSMLAQGKSHVISIVPNYPTYHIYHRTYFCFVFSSCDFPFFFFFQIPCVVLVRAWRVSFSLFLPFSVFVVIW